MVVAYFSPTAGVHQVAQAWFNAIQQENSRVNLESDLELYNYLTPPMRQQVPQFNSDDVLIFAYPIIFGRMPWAFKKWPELNGQGARAVVVTVSNNPVIDDAARETILFLQAHHFNVIAH